MRAPLLIALLACLALTPGMAEAVNSPSDPSAIHGTTDFYPNDSSSGNTDVKFNDKTGIYSEITNVYGGWSSTSNASNNTVTIDGNVDLSNGWVSGGTTSSADGAGEASGNKVIIKSGTIGNI